MRASEGKRESGRAYRGKRDRQRDGGELGLTSREREILRKYLEGDTERGRASEKANRDGANGEAGTRRSRRAENDEERERAGGRWRGGEGEWQRERTRSRGNEGERERWGEGEGLGERDTGLRERG